MNPDLQSLQSQKREFTDAPREGRPELDAREVLTRVLYEMLSGRVSDELARAFG